MTLWADADSLSPGVRDLCARRGGKQLTETEVIEVIFVAAKKIPLLPTDGCKSICVAKPDNADDYIIANAKPGDIIVTRDIPLASRALQAGLHALNDRGTIWTADSVRERLSIRDQMESLRQAGLAPMAGGGSFGKKELSAFANALEKTIQLCQKQFTRSG
ncbi:MAG: DUF188 domain-containing protein [Spirochaetes bacterium]|nr:DUF188 domain-containing protein [Spirochaetota bacterium]